MGRCRLRQRRLHRTGRRKVRTRPAAANPASKVGFWPFQVGHPSAILILPALVNRMPPKTSSMYPSSISRALCSDGMRCIKPLAPSRNETNSSRVNGGAVGAILGICSYGGPDQAEFVATIKLVQPRPEGLASRQISRPRLTFREQPVGRFVQTLLLAASIRQMTN